MLQNCAGILVKPNVTRHNLIQFNPVIINSCLLISIGLMIAIKKKRHTENDINQQGPRNLVSFWLNSVFASPLCTGMEILAWFLVEGKYYSHTWFLYTTGLLRYQSHPEKWKKAKFFFKGHRQGHSYTYWNFVIFLPYMDRFDIRIQPIEVI